MARQKTSQIRPTRLQIRFEIHTAKWILWIHRKMEEDNFSSVAGLIKSLIRDAMEKEKIDE